ncbi:MAG: SGNH/GDSL hydrolase family protein [Gemmatimonadetes bacterium]|nr:SGNH/GDSL hydrolase family protein [Gemmatimonadota bacterium]
MSRGKGLLNLLIPVVVLALLMPVAEIIVRIVKPQQLPSQEFLRQHVVKDMYVEDADAGYRLAPNFTGRIERSGIVTDFTTNSLGMRGDEPGPKNCLRVLGLGDSYTFGWGVQAGEEWIHVVGTELNRRHGDGTVQSLNGGVNGYGTVGALHALRRLGPELQPDVVLVGFFANDFTDNLLGPEIFEVRDGYLFDRFSADYFEESFLARESHLFRLGSRAWETARVKYFGGVPTTRAVKNFSEEDFQKGSDLSEQYFREMQAVCDEIGAKFGVVWLPADVYALSGSQPEDIPVRHALQERVAEAGIASVDLLPVALREGRRSGLYLLPADGHLSARGNRVMGRAVARWVEEQGWVGNTPAESPADPAASES